MSFFTESKKENPSGVAQKNIALKKAILAYFSRIGNSTIADLCAELGLSTPKINNVLTELIAENLVKDYGKLHSRGGRKPNIYGLATSSGFFLGVDVKRAHINMRLIDLQKNEVAFSPQIPYSLNNTEESLTQLFQLINSFIEEAPVDKAKILGAGISLSGRINHLTGHSYNFFHFSEEPLSKVMERNIGLPVLLENDSRTMAFGEFSSDETTEEKDVLFMNMGHGIGVGIMLNKQLYYGRSGFAGELGHIPLFNNEIICTCGKKGCLETEASGWALVRKFKEKLQMGSSSILSHLPIDTIKLPDIIEAALKDDVLAIELIAELGEKLSIGIAVLINVFNPEAVILGGSLAETGDYIRLPIKSGLNKNSLSLVNNDTQLKVSKLGDKSGVIGACLLVRDRFFEG
ncbi:MAG: ROK family protein [Chitinophagaceae bacterium]|nr:MAG: ROK family protein [Chitinophagaceae bacterium]